MKLTLEQAMDRAFDHANLNSENDDCIDIAINKYKVLRELNNDKREEIYNIIAKRLGFMEY